MEHLQPAAMEGLEHLTTFLVLLCSMLVVVAVEHTTEVLLVLVVQVLVVMAAILRLLRVQELQIVEVAGVVVDLAFRLLLEAQAAQEALA
jgi:hypothetical protein